MEEDFGRVIFLFAFVLIALVRWVLARLAERRAEREGGREEKLDDGAGREAEAWEPPRSSPRPPTDTPPAGADLNPELRRLLEAIGVETGAPPEKKTATPPPIPPPPPTERQRSTAKAKAPEKRFAVLSKAEENALDAIKKSGFHTRNLSRRQRGQRASTTVRGMLEAPQSIKQAIVLKEILDTPKALRDTPNAPLS